MKEIQNCRRRAVFFLQMAESSNSPGVSGVAMKLGNDGMRKAKVIAILADQRQNSKYRRTSQVPNQTNKQHKFPQSWILKLQGQESTNKTPSPSVTQKSPSRSQTLVVSAPSKYIQWGSTVILFSCAPKDRSGSFPEHITHGQPCFITFTSLSWFYVPYWFCINHTYSIYPLVI